MNNLKFKFGEPRYGWLEIKISDESREIVEVVSDVPCNSLYKLAKILMNLSTYSNYEEVEFSLEPEYMTWVFESEADEIEITVYPDSRRIKPVIFKGPKLKILNRLYKSLRDLEAMPCWKELNALNHVWSWEFPSRELQEFKEKVKNA